MAKKTIDDIDVAGKRILVRVDFNVPLDGDADITDDNRIRAALPTLWRLLERGASLVLMSHLGRPKGVSPGLSLAPIATELHGHLGTSVLLAPDCIGDTTAELARELKPGNVLLLENLRFHQEEEANDDDFARQLAELGNGLYVNDAFGAAHRAHASTEGITHHMSESVAGYLMSKELQYLKEALAKPAQPFVAILGGAKVSGKIEVIEHLLDKVDRLLIGGGMAYTFLKAQGHEIGNSLLEEAAVPIAADLLQKAGDRLVLPSDCLVTQKFAAGAETRVVSVDAIPADWEGVDIGPETTEQFVGLIGQAGTVVWNGPVGVFEIDDFAAGTLALAQALEQATWESGVVSIIGGGDTAAAVVKAGAHKRMTHISTGGGASLECLGGRVMPGVEALDEAAS
ncbi:MAG: phosphoglycerate kinase [Gemmatimonadetes bacterium]|jgi:phosphoglycerate kinase|nr:phosphoglycerate kinase [Gemmatimonadota bacterium]